MHYTLEQKIKRAAYTRAWVFKNRERNAEAHRVYCQRPEQKEKARIRARLWYQKNRVRAKTIQKLWTQRNPEKLKIIKCRWAEKNREAIRKRNRERNRANRKKLVAQAKARYRSDPAFRILSVQRIRLRRALKGFQKADRTLQLIGCSQEQLKKHLESLFLPGMSWDSYGQWHIDHKKPCASFNLLDPAQQRACFHYTNLQPLWAIDNMRKGANL